MADIEVTTPVQIAFEKEARREVFYQMHQTAPGKYHSMHTQRAFEMFRAGWNARETGIQETEKTDVFAKTRGWRQSVAYAVEVLESEIDIRENDDIGNRTMKRHMRVLKKLLDAEKQA